MRKMAKADAATGMAKETDARARPARITYVMSEAESNLKRHIQRVLLLNAGLVAACLEDRQLAGRLRELDRQAQGTDSLMLGSGVVAACSSCAKTTGSCCFREMGESYGFVQLFVNRLLGAELPQKPDFPGSCFFVGEKGCKLKAKHAFCLNYFCPDLINLLGDDTVLGIQRQVGQQLLAGWELELALGRYITAHSIPAH